MSDYDYDDEKAGVDYAAKYDDADDGFAEWCEENELDPEHPDTYLLFQESQSFQKDPYAYHGVHRSDFH